MSVVMIGQMDYLSMSLQMVCGHFVENRVVMEGFICGNVDIFIWGNKKCLLVKDVRVRFYLGSSPCTWHW